MVCSLSVQCNVSLCQHTTLFHSVVSTGEFSVLGTKSVAINNPVHAFQSAHGPISVEHIPKVKLLGHLVCIQTALVDSAIVFQTGCFNLDSHGDVGELPLLHVLTKAGIVCLFM